MTPANRRIAHRGFTLIEILVVIVILGILSTIVVVRTSKYSEQARIQATRATIASIVAAVGSYEMQIGRYPPDLADLVKEGDANWPGPFLETSDVPRDAWGNPFDYTIPGKRVRITSPGPDGVLGSPDDIWNS